MVADINELQAGTAAAVVRVPRRVRIVEVVGVDIVDGEEVVDEDGVVDDKKADEEAEIGLKYCRT